MNLRDLYRVTIENWQKFFGLLFSNLLKQFA